MKGSRVCKPCNVLAVRKYVWYKATPSYLQEMMATIVLPGLIYHICEMYIYDCIVYENTNKEFISSLRSISERFRLHNLFLKASSCKFGYSDN